MAKKIFNSDLETTGDVKGATVTGGTITGSTIVSPLVSAPTGTNLLLSGSKKNLDALNKYSVYLSSEGNSIEDYNGAHIRMESTDKDYIENPVSDPGQVSDAEAGVVISAFANYGDDNYQDSEATVSLLVGARSGGVNSSAFLTLDHEKVVIQGPNGVGKIALSGTSGCELNYENGSLNISEDIKMAPGSHITTSVLELFDSDNNSAAGAEIHISANGVTETNPNYTTAKIKRSVDPVDGALRSNLLVGDGLSALRGERVVAGGYGLEASKLYSSDIGFQYGTTANVEHIGTDAFRGGEMAFVVMDVSSNMTGELITIGDASDLPSYSDSTPLNTGADAIYNVQCGRDGRIYRGNVAHFSAVHTYISDSSIAIGMAVTLQNGKVSLADSSNSPLCVGIVASSEVIDSNTIDNWDSLGNTDIAEGLHRNRVICTGDTRHLSSTGFNVCNENGDITAGDLLVTSSTPGYLMKQDDDIIRSKTVGKAMEQVTFDENGQATGIYGYIYCG